ncbi:Hypothetical protein I596_1311 [Dokdonella koreensis DS-123]|uniref:Uncharacterized protein n=1 Tax=Dokdonella koreensis DS-123 TaxID=1300342 RepID=A0A160DTN0_9GAMM|nr:Hypothetical protein I596_1311 [Dokdonella koreensis DS-123]
MTILAPAGPVTAGSPRHPRPAALQDDPIVRGPVPHADRASGTASRFDRQAAV